MPLEDFFMTMNAAEMSNAVLHLGYADECIVGWAYPNDGPGREALYRLLGPSHFYTTSQQEDQSLIGGPHADWHDEGIAGWVCASQTPDSVPLYRLVGPDATHEYTASDAERNKILSDPHWSLEGTIGYVFPAQSPGTQPLLRARKDLRAFPMVHDSGDVNVAAGEHVQCVAKLSQSGLLEATTHTWCTKWFAGFHGGVLLTLEDEATNTVWPPTASTTHQQYGVDGSYTGMNASRIDKVEYQIPPDALEQTASINVYCFQDPKNMFWTDVHLIAKNAAEIKQLFS